MSTLFDAPGLTVTHDADQRILQLRWRGKRADELTVTYLAVVLRQVRATRSTAILTDATLDADDWTNLTGWLAEDYFQDLADNGVKAVAWVVSRNQQARADMNDVLINVTRPLTDSFADAEAAYAWLRTMV